MSEFHSIDPLSKNEISPDGTAESLSNLPMRKAFQYAADLDNGTIKLAFGCATGDELLNAWRKANQ